jgi:AraC-like DNA-binding protein
MKPIFEKVPVLETRSFYTEVVRPETEPTPWHFHPECQITLVLEGTGHRMVGDHIANFQAGDLVFVGPNLPHAWHHDPLRGSGRSTATLSIVVQFLQDFLGEPFLRIPEMDAVRRMIRRGALTFPARGSAHGEIVRLLEGLVQAQGLRRVVLLLEVLERLSETPEAQVLSSPEFQPTLNPYDQQRVGVACEYIHENLHRPVLREDLARLLHLSPDAFGRFFRSRTGKTLPNFVNELRVGRACRLLCETGRSITQIALACGFENISNFNRQFKKHTTRTPREHRKACL